jgi:hypothetical protein
VLWDDVLHRPYLRTIKVVHCGPFLSCVKRRERLCCQRYKCRLVEAKIAAPSLGTRGGGSQWCNRLPEVVMTSGAYFAS